MFFKRLVRVGFIVVLTHLAPLHGAFAAQLPSLFRGVVVADSPLGVRVVSVEESSQASLADLRPEDLIVRVRDTEVHSIDEFATLSNAMNGHAISATVLVFRNGMPRELTLHLYSYPILQAWGIRFLPDHDIRFADPQIGLAYWARLGRGFEEAGNVPDALDAYLNGLHNVPRDPATAMNVSTLLSQMSQQRLRSGALAEGLERLHESLLMLEQLFDSPLSDDQLKEVRRQLHDALHALRRLRPPPAAS
ncbi:MAG: PDZ domain-containing protein [Candidatus Omnitrophica bacterium]|nr:PDZ domain-containing protein [Candidatus Omnitrophota bacterium]